MVAMIDPRNVTTLYVVERDALERPLTVMVVDPSGDPAVEERSLYRLVSVETAAEPTWEDAAWQ